jgi:hypothetical protein
VRFSGFERTLGEPPDKVLNFLYIIPYPLAKVNVHFSNIFGSQIVGFM